ncbi:Vms1/Ankzf1 family peptidyl-tRNA hydrolase [Pengzhenrongella phosphoraccumulans]|uniref:baeRF2 domain-containing protein n=1 Tax=Pengzhenrongella phosphoraccumulans TaxID=3114394 RepID=UPI0038906716
MKLQWLKPLLGRSGPFTTVYLDATRADSAGESEAVDRWRGLRRELEHAGAPVGVLASLEEAVERPTWVSGPHGRVLIADVDGVCVDRVLADPPARSVAVYEAVPALLPAVRAADQTVDYLVIEVDRQGADLLWPGPSGQVGEVLHDVIDGGHDVVHKMREGGMSHRRMQTRAEDSWERNADAVAAELDRVVAARDPELVLITGDVRAVALVRDGVGQRAAELLVEVPGGSRAQGVKADVFAQRVRQALELFRTRRRELVLSRFRQEKGRDEGAVTELGDVIEVLRRGQVRDLVLAEPPLGQASSLADRTVWVGPDPLHIGLDRDDLESIGVVDGARELPAEVGLIRAALGQDAGVTFAVDGSVELIDGVGAVLRWTDPGTPSESVVSQSGDRARLREVV